MAEWDQKLDSNGISQAALSLQESHSAFLSQEIMILGTVLLRALQKDQPNGIYGR